MIISTSQTVELSRPLFDIVIRFYSDPENEEEFQKWLSKAGNLAEQNVEN